MAHSRGASSASSAAASPLKDSVASNPLSEIYPVDTLWELALEDGDTAAGRVYCTDEFSQSVVLQRPLAHTTLASELFIVNAAAIRHATRQPETEGGSSWEEASAVPLFKPLPKVHRRALEERERKALRQAEESFRQINQKATPRGQACFDRLLKACSEAAWQGESIVVLNQVRVDPPYTPESCFSIAASASTASATSHPSQQQQRAAHHKKASEEASLERVRKIVAAVASDEAGP